MSHAHSLFDRSVAAVALTVLSPALLAIAAVIRREDGPPVVFRQQRTGLGGAPFTMYKFRTMRTAQQPGPAVTVRGDSRVTPLGRRLRSLKLDELPQLVNVVRGDMALVGPRPELPQYTDLWDSHLRDVILSVRPGITDPMTVQLRREEELLAAQDDPQAYYENVLLPEKAAAYADYARSKSFSGDLRVLGATVAAVARR